MAEEQLQAGWSPLSPGSQRWFLLSTQKSASRNWQQHRGWDRNTDKGPTPGDAGNQAGTGLRAAVKALWKCAVESGNQENKVEILHSLPMFHSKRHFNFCGRFDYTHSYAWCLLLTCPRGYHQLAAYFCHTGFLIS